MSRVLFCLILACLGCGRSEPVEIPNVVLDTLGGAAPEGFARVLGPQDFEFPRDDGPHPDYHIEWWYFTGNTSEVGSNRHFGFELTFFRIGLDANPEPRETAWATSQLYLSHLALTDTQNDQFYFAEKLNRGVLELAGAKATPFRVWNEEWSIKDLDADGETPFPMALKAAEAEFGVELTLRNVKPRIYPGERGFSRKGPEEGNASYYLTFPRLSVEGEVRVGEERVAVEGTAWMDHEWSTSVLGDTLAGWDWFALQFEDGTDLMLYELRRKSGSRGNYSQGIRVFPDGTTRPLKLSDFQIRVTDTWTSPTTQITYPSRWTISLPAESLTLTVVPVIEKQELALRTVYWEGAVSATLETQGKTYGGRGYVELVGYGQGDTDR